MSETQEPANLYTVTVVEGEYPEVQEHASLADLVEHLKSIIEDRGTACYVFSGRRIMFSNGRIPHLLLESGNIPLVEDSLDANLTGIVGDDVGYSDEDTEEPETKHFDDSGPELPDTSDEEEHASDEILDAWEDDGDDD